VWWRLDRFGKLWVRRRSRAGRSSLVPRYEGLLSCLASCSSRRIYSSEYR